MYPRATVDESLHLAALGIIDRENAMICGVSIRAVQHWRTGRRRSPSTHVKAGCPRCHGRSLDEPAYAYLLGIFLGDGWLSRGPQDVFGLSIACSYDWPGLVMAAKAAMAAVMPACGVLAVQRPGHTEIKSASKHWPCLFPQHGPGKKHARETELAQWQRAVVGQYPGDFARGLFHSSGWRGVNRVRRLLADGEHWYAYPRYLFSNGSEQVMRQCGEALDTLGVTWCRSKPNTISVARRDAVARLDEFVGPKY